LPFVLQESFVKVHSLSRSLFSRIPPLHRNTSDGEFFFLLSRCLCVCISVWLEACFVPHGLHPTRPLCTLQYLLLSPSAFPPQSKLDSLDGAWPIHSHAFCHGPGIPHSSSCRFFFLTLPCSSLFFGAFQLHIMH